MRMETQINLIGEWKYESFAFKKLNENETHPQAQMRIRIIRIRITINAYKKFSVSYKNFSVLQIFLG